LLVLDHNYVRRVAIVGGLVVTAGPFELKVWEIRRGSYKLRPVRRVRVSFQRKGGGWLETLCCPSRQEPTRHSAACFS
jgi:hypothetical protein